MKINFSLNCFLNNFKQKSNIWDSILSCWEPRDHPEGLNPTVWALWMIPSSASCFIPPYFPSLLLYFPFFLPSFFPSLTPSFIPSFSTSLLLFFLRSLIHLQVKKVRGMHPSAGPPKNSHYNAGRYRQNSILYPESSSFPTYFPCTNILGPFYYFILGILCPNTYCWRFYFFFWTDYIFS